MNIDVIKRRVLASRKKADLLLDRFPNAAAAYSLRLLNSQYTGDCIEVRRSSDDALQNIGFLNGEVDTASLLSFVGAGDGFVRTWYDQSGNARDVFQTDNSIQPKIIKDGNLISLNNKQAINSEFAADRLIASTSSDWVFMHSSKCSIFSVFESNNLDPSQHLLGTSSGAYVGRRGINLRLRNGYSVGNGDDIVVANKNFNTVSQTGLQKIMSILSDMTKSVGNRLDIFLNNISFGGSETGTGNPSQDNAFPLTLFFRAGSPTQGFRARCQEIIIYPTDQSNNRTAIEQNINAYYNIF